MIWRRTKRTVEYNSPLSYEMREEDIIRKSYVVTAKEMQAYDTYTIENIGMDVMVLMERAALALASAVSERLHSLFPLKERGKVLCICGTGNNGGDGLACARILADKNIRVDVYLAGSKEKLRPAVKKQLFILEQIGIPVYENDFSGIRLSEYDVIVDALFGTGLCRDITGKYLELIEMVNASGTYVIAADIPSGISADNGHVLTAAVKANETITFAFGKRGLYLYPGCEYSGKITVADIGITEKSFAGHLPEMYTLSGNAKCIFQNRKPDGNKGTFGKILITAGSRNMAGAAILCAASAYKAGAGMVKLMIPESIKTAVQISLPEALICTYDKEEELKDSEKNLFLQSMQWADVFISGPGLGKKETGKMLLKILLTESSKPLLIDADALNILAENVSLLECVKTMNNREIVLTPHMGELARLLKRPVKEVTENEPEAVKELARQLNCVVAGKSARSYVFKNEMPMFLNTCGNDRMATAGSGDVLSGVIGALLAQGLNAYDAAVHGVFLHAKAGDEACKKADGTAIRAIEIVNAFQKEDNTQQKKER